MFGSPRQELSDADQRRSQPPSRHDGARCLSVAAIPRTLTRTPRPTRRGRAPRSPLQPADDAGGGDEDVELPGCSRSAANALVDAMSRRARRRRRAQPPGTLAGGARSSTAPRAPSAASGGRCPRRAAGAPGDARPSSLERRPVELIATAPGSRSSVGGRIAARPSRRRRSPRRRPPRPSSGSRARARRSARRPRRSAARPEACPGRGRPRVAARAHRRARGHDLARVERAERLLPEPAVADAPARRSAGRSGRRRGGHAGPASARQTTSAGSV